MLRLRDLLAVSAALAALSFVVGCGGDGDGGEASPAEGTYLGEVEGTEAYIALLTNGNQLAGFVCNGTPGAVDVYFWLDNAEITDGSAELVSRQGDPLGDASFADDQATGEVSIDGTSHSFTAETRDGPGVFRAIKGEDRCARPG